MLRNAIQLLFFASVLLQSCNMKFEKGKWKRTDPAFPPEERPRMLNDLIKNYKLIGVKYNALIALLGSPDFIDSSNRRISYEIKLHYDMIDPDSGEYLEFDFDSDSTIRKYNVRDWKK